MNLKNGYNYSDYFCEYYDVEDVEGDAEVAIEIRGIKTESGEGFGYGTTVHMQDGKITAFTIKSYDIELTIPATIEMHNKIRALIDDSL